MKTFQDLAVVGGLWAAWYLVPAAAPAWATLLVTYLIQSGLIVPPRR